MKIKNTIKQWLNSIPKPSKKSELRDFEDKDGKSWSRISELVGSDIASNWFKEIVNP